MRKRLFVLVCLISILLGWLGRIVPLAEQSAVYSSLGQIAAIVFGLMGAWIAIVYPGALANILGRNDGTATDAQELVNKLTIPMVISTAVVLSSLVFGSFAPVLKRMPLALYFRVHLLGVSFAFLSFGTLMLMYAVLVTMVPLDRLKSVAEQQAEDEKISARKLKRG